MHTVLKNLCNSKSLNQIAGYKPTLLLQEANSIVESKSWPVLLDTSDLSKKNRLAVYMPPSTEMLCYLDFSVSTTGMLAGIKVC